MVGNCVGSRSVARYQGERGCFLPSLATQGDNASQADLSVLAIACLGQVSYLPAKHATIGDGASAAFVEQVHVAPNPDDEWMPALRSARKRLARPKPRSATTTISTPGGRSALMVVQSVDS